MLGWKIMERQQIAVVFGQAFRRPVIFHTVSLDEEIKGSGGSGFGSLRSSSPRAARPQPVAIDASLEGHPVLKAP